MRLLLDTHALLWWLSDPALLAPPARTAIEMPESVVLISAAVGWEIGIKHAIGKLRCPDNLEEVIAANGFRTLSVSLRHALEAGKLPLHHQDPFDRLLVAQARSEGFTLVTRDAALAAYQVTILAA